MRDKTVVITGASRGLGLALARHWAAHNRVINLSRTPAADDAAAGVQHVPCDLSDMAQTRAALQQLLREHPAVDLLVNNAAVLTTLPLGVMAAADIARMIDVNLKAPILVSKAVFRKMAGRRRGQIVNILSMAPRLCVVGDSVYAATKAGLEAFSRVLNREGHPFGVHVNNIGLSAYPSGMLDKVIGSNADKVLDLIPHHGFAPIAEVIAAIEFFEANGQDIGGQTLYFGGVA
jgi:NAD(P)-dependent dehydrogenase (short-subunit alcohol dehydrogenase family)